MLSRSSKASDKMKKIICVLFAVLLTLSLPACNSVKDNSSSLQSSDLIHNSSDTQIVKSENAESSEETDTVNTNSEQTNQVQGSQVVSTEDKNSSTTSVIVKSNVDDISQSSSNTSSLTYEDYENLNKNSPVQGEREWKFHSTDPDYAAPYDPSELAECCITIDETDHVTIFWNYYYKAENHPEFSVGGNESVKFDGTDYYWFLCYRYEGTCFVEQNGVISIQLKCTNDWGDYVNDEITLQRDGNDKLIVTSHAGTEFNLFKGDEFVR